MFFPDEGQTLVLGAPPQEEDRAQTITGCSSRTKVKHSFSALLLRMKVERRPYPDVLPGWRSNTRAWRSSLGREVKRRPYPDVLPGR
ncbi:unnamed protein product, partial [Cuscuta campestris]